MNCLNLGSGSDYREGWVNLDYLFSSNPNHNFKADVTHNLEELPLPFKDKEFDKIICYHTLEHINTGMVEFMNEMWRLLKKGGTLEIRTPHFSSWNAYCFYHERQFNIRDFMLKYNNVGSYPPFKVVKAELHTQMMSLPRKWYHKVIDFLANLNPVFCESFWCYWVGGFKEIEVIYRK